MFRVHEASKDAVSFNLLKFSQLLVEPGGPLGVQGVWLSLESQQRGHARSAMDPRVVQEFIRALHGPFPP